MLFTFKSQISSSSENTGYFPVNWSFPPQRKSALICSRIARLESSTTFRDQQDLRKLSFQETKLPSSDTRQNWDPCILMSQSEQGVGFAKKEHRIQRHNVHSNQADEEVQSSWSQCKMNLSTLSSFFATFLLPSDWDIRDLHSNLYVIKAALTFKSSCPGNLAGL